MNLMLIVLRSCSKHPAVWMEKWVDPVIWPGLKYLTECLKHLSSFKGKHFNISVLTDLFIKIRKFASQSFSLVLFYLKHIRMSRYQRPLMRSERLIIRIFFFGCIKFYHKTIIIMVKLFPGLKNIHTNTYKSDDSSCETQCYFVLIIKHCYSNMPKQDGSGSKQRWRHWLFNCTTIKIQIRKNLMH